MSVNLDKPWTPEELRRFYARAEQIGLKLGAWSPLPKSAREDERLERRALYLLFAGPRVWDLTSHPRRVTRWPSTSRS